MTWLDQLRPASFRGVPFQVDSIAVEAGDNVVLREYPFQDLPTVFRMGDGVEEIKFSAYVIGDDYDQQRDALREALTGPGVLMHPTAGAIRVWCAGKYTIKEAPTAEGGMARFDLVFVRAEPRRYPTAVASTPQDALAKADAAKQAAKDAFAAQWSTLGQPGWVADRAVARLRSAVDGVWGPMSALSQQLGDFSSQVIGNYQALSQGFDQLVSTPAQLADNVATLFELPTELSDDVARNLQGALAWAFDLDQRLSSDDFEVISMPAVGAGLVMYGTGNATALDPNSPGRPQLTQLYDAGDRLIETLATAAWVQATASVELASYDDAIAMRQTIGDQLTRLISDDSEAPAAASLPASSWHDALMALYAAALADLQARSRDLVRLTSYTPQSWQSVWTISYRLFGTTTYADEIAAMNPHIRHPLLVPPGVPLRIMKHA